MLALEVEATSSKGRLIKIIRKALDDIFDNSEKTNEGKVSSMKTVISHLDPSVTPSLEPSVQPEAEKEVNALEEAYANLLKKFEEEKKELWYLANCLWKTFIMSCT